MAGLAWLGWRAGSYRTLPLVILLGLIAVSDLRRRVIPDTLTLPGLAYGLAASLAPGMSPSLGPAAAGALAIGGLGLLIAVVSRGGLGGGDVKLMALLGAALGWREALAAVALSQIAGVVVVIALVIWHRGWPRRRRLPIGAFIAVIGALFLLARR